MNNPASPLKVINVPARPPTAPVPFQGPSRSYFSVLLGPPNGSGGGGSSSSSSSSGSSSSSLSFGVWQVGPVEWGGSLLIGGLQGLEC